MADVIHKTTMVFERSVNTPDYPSGTYLINPLFDPDEATILAVPELHRKITGGDTVEEMTAAEKLDNPLPGVDAAAAGSFKDAVRAATTGALPAHTRSGNVLTASANGALPAQDGITLTEDQRLMVKDEGGGTHLENGPYILATVGDGTHPWKLQRASDCNLDATVDTCLVIWVQEGTVNGGGKFELTTVGPITVNTTALTFSVITNVLQQVQTQTGAVNTGTTAIPYDDTIPQITQGDEYMTKAITPKSASSILQIDVVMHLSHSTSSTFLTAALFRDAVAGALAAGGGFMPTATGAVMLCFSFQEASGSTTARTYRARGGSSNAGTTTFNGQAGVRRLGGVMTSSITITEIG